MAPTIQTFSGTTNLNLKDGLIRFARTHTTSPFQSKESGLWVDSNNRLRFSYNGTDYDFNDTSQSVSPSQSPSVSISASVSPSKSPSVSPSRSPSASPSASVSRSVSPSVSPS